MNFELYNNSPVRDVLTEIDEYAEFMKMCVCFLVKNEAFNEVERTAIKNAYEAVADSLKRNLDFVFNRPLGILGKPFNGAYLSSSQSLSLDKVNSPQSNEEGRKAE